MEFFPPWSVSHRPESVRLLVGETPTREKQNTFGVLPPLLVFSPTTCVRAGLGSWLLLYSMYTMTNGLHLIGENLPAGRLAPTRAVDRESCTFIMQVNFIVSKASKFFHGV